MNQSPTDQKQSALRTTPLPRPVWVLSWVSFFADVSSEMMYPLLPLFLVSVLGASKLELGAMEGGAVCLVAVMSAVAGMRSDRRGPRGGRVPWIRWGYGLPVIGKTMIALSSVWPLVLGGRLLDRFGKGLRGAPRDALIADVVAVDQRGRAFGLHRAFDTAGALLGVLLAALLLWGLTGTPDQSGAGVTPEAATTPAWVYRAIFGVSAALGLASLALTLLVKESDHEDDSAQDRPPTSHAATVTGWRALPAAYWLTLAILILFSVANSSDTFLLLRAGELGYSPWAVVLAYALFNVTYAGVAYPAGLLSDRWGRWRIIAVGWALYAGVYFGFALLPVEHAWGLWPLMALYGVYMALTDGIGKALIADHAPRDARGTAMGLFYGLTGLTTLAASLLAGVLWDQYGSQLALLLGAGMAVFALAALFMMRRKLTASPED